VSFRNTLLCCTKEDQLSTRVLCRVSGLYCSAWIQSERKGGTVVLLGISIMMQTFRSVFRKLDVALDLCFQTLAV